MELLITTDGKMVPRMYGGNGHIIGVAGLFLLSWLPLNAYMLAVDVMYPTDDINFKPQVKSQDLYLPLAVCHLIAMSSAVSNPIVYGFFNSNIRHELFQLLPKRCAPKPRNQIRRNATDDQTTRTNLQTFNATGGASTQINHRTGSEENLTTTEIVINNNKSIVTMF